MAEQNIDESLHLFRVFTRAFQSIMEDTERDIKSHGFHPTAFAVLELLYHQGPQPLQKIGSAILLASGSITYVINKLETQGFIERQACPTDRRITYAAITHKGQERMANIFPQHAAAIHQRLDRLSNEERHQLIHLLKKIGQSCE